MATVFGKPEVGDRVKGRARNYIDFDGPIASIDPASGDVVMEVDMAAGFEVMPTQFNISKFVLGKSQLYGTSGRIRYERVGLIGSRIRLLNWDESLHPGACRVGYEAEHDSRSRTFPIMIWVSELTITDHSFEAIGEIIPLRRE